MNTKTLALIAMLFVIPVNAFGFDPIAAPAAMIYFEKRFGAEVAPPVRAGIRFDVRGAILRPHAGSIEPVPALLELRLTGTGAGPVLLLSGVPLWHPARVFRIEGVTVDTEAENAGKPKIKAGQVARGVLGLALLGGMSAYALKHADTDEEKVETVARIIEALGS